MNAETSRQLDSETIKRILNLLDEFLQSDFDCVRPVPGLTGEAGRSSVDGDHFFRSFTRFLDGRDDSAGVMVQFAHMLAVSGFVRNGGSRMMLYRLETGCRTVVADYFQDMSQRLNLAVYKAYSAARKDGEINSSAARIAQAPSNASGEQVVSAENIGATNEQQETTPFQQAGAEQGESASSLISLLRQSNGEEERQVGLFILEIDAILIEISRRLDAELKSEWVVESALQR